MAAHLDETHDATLTSWVPSANVAGTDFPIQNLPLGVFRAAAGRAHIGTAIGDAILDLTACAESGVLTGDIALACREEHLNALMSLGAERRRELRRSVSALLRAGAPPLPSALLLVPQSDVQMLLPAQIGDYTDFYASIHHARRVGALFRPENPLLPNYKWVPIAYHGRTSSIVVSGTTVRRPVGQTHPDGASMPRFGASRRLDYEVEIGFFVGPGNALGEPIPLPSAEEHLFGACLVNDWSARDVQKWESQPLGPFLAKNFATTVSPWVVTLEALAPFRGGLAPRPLEDPAPLEYLSGAEDLKSGGFDIRVEVHLSSRDMREQGLPPFRVSTALFLDMYWTPAQMLTHHTSNGCNLRAADLIASGTVSGPAEDSGGCLLERTRGGQLPLSLPSGETRRSLEHGDEVILRAYCERAGFAQIGFGDCRGVVDSRP